MKNRVRKLVDTQNCLNLWAFYGPDGHKALCYINLNANWVRQAKPGRLGGGEYLRNFLLGTQQVTNPARPSVPTAGTECCVAMG